ncbi:hypothetical protein [Streptomyces sp. NPDC094437]|uniref:hypothetical protein n=1 Tax=Streptomyces sp. NPDC094437 TaxID=3366060 RepID=UPI003827F7D2
MLRATVSGGFWCECWTQRLNGRRPPVLFGSYDAYSAAEANNWVATMLRTISPALDTTASQEAWTRLHDHRADTRRALLHHEPWTASITHISTRVTWTIRPVRFLPMAHREEKELPSCAYEFNPHRPWLPHRTD